MTEVGFLYFFFSGLIYTILAYRMVRAAIRYRTLRDVRVVFWIAAPIWVYYVMIYLMASVALVTGWALPVTVYNMRDWLWPLGLPLLVSTSYLIYRIFP